MIEGKNSREETGIFWMIAIQILYLIYYLSYSNVLINTNIILMASCLILLVKIITRLIHNSMRVSVRLLLAGVGSLWAFMSSMINGSGFGSAVTQTFLLLSVCLLAETTIPLLQHKKIMKCMALTISIVLVAFSRPTPYKSRFMSILPYMGDEVSINPNCIAMLTFFLFVYLFRMVEETKWKKRSKIITQFVIMVLCISYIYFTSARTAIVSCIIFVVLFWICKYKDYKLTRMMFFIGLCMSLGIIFVYTEMYSSGFLVGEVVGGKGFYSGREVIWAEALDILADNLIFGFSNKTTFGSSKLLSLHNSLLAVLCYFGLFGLLTTVAVLYMSFKKIDYKNNTMAVSALFASLFFISFETMITDWSLLVPFCFLFLQEKKERKDFHDT